MHFFEFPKIVEFNFRLFNASLFYVFFKCPILPILRIVHMHFGAFHNTLRINVYGFLNISGFKKLKFLKSFECYPICGP